MQNRIGIGYDIHRLTEGRKLILGGVEIPYFKGLEGHSDADALMHAVIDALLGATASGDIGEIFPDTDPKYSGADSGRLLKQVLDLVRVKKFKIENVDTVIIAEEPKLFPFKKQIQKNIARILGIPEDCVGVKAKTNKGIGEIGDAKAIAVYAVVNLSRRSKWLF